MKFIGLVIAALLTISAVAKATVNFSEVRRSVFRIAILKRSGIPGRAKWFGTGFFVKDKKLGNVIVTNNHICADMVKGVPVVITSKDGEIHPETFKKDVEPIVYIYMAPGMDICIVKPEIEHPGLELSSIGPNIYDKITVTGFDGENYMLISEGYIYGYADQYYFDHVEETSPEKCNFGSPEFFSAIQHGAIPIFKHVTQLKSTARISPGYSGSPVFSSTGMVIGIVNAYNPPTDMDLKSYSYMHTVIDIKTALAGVKFHPYLAYKNQIDLLNDWNEISEDLEEIQTHFKSGEGPIK